MSSPVPCVPCCTTPQVVNTPGSQGLAGTNGTNGTNGANGYTITTADFVVPVTNNNVTISVLSTAFMVIGQVFIVGQGTLALADPGPMTGQVVSIPSVSSVQLKALGAPGDVASGTTIGSGTNAGGALVSPSGVPLTSPIGIANGGTGQTTAAAAARALTARDRLLGSILGANMNTTADQSIPVASAKYIPTLIYATNASTNLTTAAGGIYTAAAKGGTVIVPAAQVYTALTAAAKWKALTIDPTGGGPTTDVVVAATLFLSLTTPQGGAATADIYIFGQDLN
jgi:hypothetical protein